MNPRPDVIVLNKLVDAGVNINKRPYVWERVYIISNNLLVNIGSDSIAINPSITEKGKEETINNFMNDCNSLIEALLEAGADPIC